MVNGQPRVDLNTEKKKIWMEKMVMDNDLF